jgi:hypothetical protein
VIRVMSESTIIERFEPWEPNDNYSHGALNCVESDTQSHAEYLAGAGYPVELEPIKTDRSIDGYEFADSLSRVERNIDALAQAFFAPPGYQQPKEWAPNMRHIYIDANRLENNLELIYIWAILTARSFKHCGTFACGEEGAYSFIDIKTLWKEVFEQIFDDELNALATKTADYKVCLSTEQRPAGHQGDTLLEYDPVKKTAIVYIYISDDWREI